MRIFHNKPVSPAALALLDASDKRSFKYCNKVLRQMESEGNVLKAVQKIAELNGREPAKKPPKQN